MNDIVRAIDQRKGRERASLADAMLETLGGICEHRPAPAARQPIQKPAKARQASQASGS